MTRRQAGLLGLVVALVPIVGVAVVKDRGGNDGPAVVPRTGDLVFVSNRSGHRAIWTLDGANTVQVSPEGVEAYAPALSGDGRLLAYAEVVGDGSFDVMVDSGDGRPKRVTRSPGPIGRIGWSSDGVRLVFDRVLVDGPRLSSEIVVVDRREGSERVILRRPNRSLGGVAWRLGADEIAVVEVEETAESRITFLDANTGAQVADPIEGGLSPAWDAAGRRLAFVRSTVTGWLLAVGDAHGQMPRTILTRSRLVFGPAWTGAGELVFEYYPAGQQEPDLWSVDTGSGDVRPVVQDPGFAGSAAGRR